MIVLMFSRTPKINLLHRQPSKIPFILPNKPAEYEDGAQEIEAAKHSRRYGSGGSAREDRKKGTIGKGGFVADGLGERMFPWQG